MIEKKELIYLGQEQDEDGFQGEMEDYRFYELPVRMTGTFLYTYKDHVHEIIPAALERIMEIPGKKERIQRFVFDSKQIWVVSNAESGIDINDYYDSEEFGVVFMLPSDY